MSLSALEEDWSVTPPAAGHSGYEPELSRSVDMPVWVFSANGKRLTCDKPVAITVAEESGGYLAGCERLHVFSYGANAEEAVRLLNDQVVHFFGVYTALAEDRVTGLAVECAASIYSTFEKVPFKFGDVSRSLRKKGFVRDNSHHKYRHHEYNGQRTGAYTYVSHGSGSEDVGPVVESCMRLQLKLQSVNDVRRLVKCPMKKEDYIQALRDAGALDS